MGSVGTWAANLCYAAVGCAVIGFVLPRGNVEKLARSLLGLFLVWVAFSPISAFFAKKNGDVWEPSFREESGADVSGAVGDYLCERTEQTLLAVLEKESLPVVSVRAQWHITADGVIDINKIEIVCKGGAEAIQDTVLRETGLLPDITIE